MCDGFKSFDYTHSLSAEEIAFEIGHFRTFQNSVSLTLTVDRVTHTVMYHLSTSTYKSNFVQIGKTFCGQTDGRTLLRPASLDQLGGIDLTTSYVFRESQSAIAYCSRCQTASVRVTT